MSDLRAIADLYAEVDDSLEALRDKAVADGATTQRERIERKQRINDQAYFVLAWGQLEADIVDACRSTIRHALTHGDWRDRRAWTLYNPDDRRLSGLSFENRLTLVLEKRSENWKKVSQHYSVRNQIAHGRLRSQRTDVSRVIDESIPSRHLWRTIEPARPSPTSLTAHLLVTHCPFARSQEFL